MDQTDKHIRKKKLGPSFWVAFRKSAKGAAKKETKKKNGEVITETGDYYVYYRDKYGKTITDDEGGYPTKALAKRGGEKDGVHYKGMEEFRKKIAGATTEEVRQKIQENDERIIANLIYKFIQIKIKNARKKGTGLNYKNRLPKLVEFLKAIGKPLMKVDEFAVKYVFMFKDWLLTNGGRNDDGHNNGGTKGILTVAKAFFSWAKDCELYTGPNQFKIKNDSGYTVMSKNVLPKTHNPYYLSHQEIRILFESIRISVTPKRKNPGKCPCGFCRKRRANAPAKQMAYYPTVPSIIKRREEFAEIVEVALQSCMRENELANLQREWINIVSEDKCVISIPAEFSKSGEARGIVIKNHPEIVQIFARVSSGYIWPKWSAQRISKAFTRIVKRAKKILEFKGNPTFHSLRHTGAKLFLENGGTLQDLSDRLGHSDITTTMIYKQFENREAQEIVSGRIKIDTSPILKIVN